MRSGISKSAFALLAFLAAADARAADCDADTFVAPLKSKYAGKVPDDECVQNRDAKCPNIDPAKLKPGSLESACKMVYKQINDTIAEYKSKLDAYCTVTANELAKCSTLTGDKLAICQANHSRVVASEQAKLIKAFDDAKADLVTFESAAKTAREKYLELARIWYPNVGRPVGQAPLPPRPPGRGASTPDFECTGKPDGMAVFTALTPQNPKNLDTSPLVSELVRAIKFSEAFRTDATSSSRRHRETKTRFEEQARKFDSLAGRTRSVDPNQPKAPDAKKGSDITGTENKSPAQQAAAPAGGAPPGGAPAGGAPATGATPVDQGLGGATAGTPTSTNNSGSNAADKTDKAAKVGTTPVGSRTGEGVQAELPVPVGAKLPSGTGFGSGLASSRSASSDRSGSSGRGAASGKNSGGGGGGGVGGGKEGKACLGQDCQQALGNIKSGQFAPVGSLGGGGGSLGSLGIDDSGSLDSLFKPDDPSKMNPLAGLEGGDNNGLAALEAGMSGGNEQSAGGGEIGKVDGRDLFQRVKLFYVRAIKRGFVQGVPKKL